MLKVENVEVLGWEHAIRGMRNPKNSWAKSDSGPECPYGKEKCCGECQQNFCIGPNDKQLMMALRNALGWNMETVMQTNIDKLRARYPDGFDAEHSLHRRANDI